MRRLLPFAALASVLDLRAVLPDALLYRHNDLVVHAAMADPRQQLQRFLQRGREAQGSFSVVSLLRRRHSSNVNGVS